MIEPMTRAQHLQRRWCCQNGCFHCPWDYAGNGNPPITEAERRKYKIQEDGQRCVTNQRNPLLIQHVY